MDRRDLLLFRSVSGKKVFELACERLYMCVLDSRRPGPPSEAPGDYWLGEPEPHLVSSSLRELFDGLRRDLAGADVLRVVGPQWLADAELRREVDALVAEQRMSGRRVEWVDEAPGSTATAGLRPLSSSTPSTARSRA